MNKPFIFVSCGQYTEEEKLLGKAIVQLVKSVTGQDAFFAEEVHDLAGLDSNILQALRECSAFITVLHPRGLITRPDNTEHVRASVWIEQEIAIATYIQRVEERPLPVLAFIHRSVGLEGLRALIHLNPIPFSRDAEVLAALPARLASWKSLQPTGVHLEMQATDPVPQEGHPVRQLRITLVNDTNNPITTYSARVSLPSGVLEHWSKTYTGEERSVDLRRRVFRFDEKGRGAIPPHSERLLVRFDYCIRCAVEKYGDHLRLAELAIANSEFDVAVWIDGKEYRSIKKTKELSARINELDLGG